MPALANTHLSLPGSIGAWALAGDVSPGTNGLVTVDLDATIVIAHSDKEQAGLRPSTSKGRPLRGHPFAFPCRPAADQVGGTRTGIAPW